jgi:hypothetical protein
MVAVSSSVFSQGYPPGPQRQAFIAGAKKSCFNQQVGAEENKYLTIGELTGYCECYATNLANTLSPYLKAKDVDVNSLEMQKQINAAAKPCLEAIKPR